MTETGRFRTERLVGPPWQIEDLPLAMKLWGDPAVTALIDSRGKLTTAQVGEKLRADIERERSGGVQYWALFDHRNGEFVGCGGHVRVVAVGVSIRAPVRGDPMCRKAWQASVTWPNASSAVGIREIRYNVCGLLPTSTQVEPRTRPTQGNGR